MYKILFAVNNMGLGGAERIVAGQIKHIDRTRFEPYLLTLKGEREESIWKEVDMGSRRKFHILIRGVLDVRGLLGIIRLLRANRMDIVVTNLFLPNTLVRTAAILAGVKYIFSYEHSIYPNKRVWQKVVDRILANFTKSIFVGATDVKEFTARQVGIPLNKFVLNYNAADIAEIQVTREKGAKLRSRFNINEDTIVIVAVGRLVTKKGHTYLVSAMKKIVFDGIKNVCCLIFGQGPLEEELHTSIEQKQLESCIKLVGTAPMNDILSACDIFVLPSLSEGLSIALVQAMAAQKAIIATKISGSNEAIVDGHNGLLVPAEDSDTLAFALQKLIMDESLREGLAHGALESSKKFSIVENVRRLERTILESM